MNWIQKLLNVDKPIIGMIHLKALPGSCLYQAGCDGLTEVIRRAKQDYRSLVEGGIHSVIFCNENEKPYATCVKPHVVAMMTTIIHEVRKDEKKIPFGVDVQWDACAALAVAAATRASYIRGIVCGTYCGDLGIFTPDTAEILSYRHQIHADHIRILTNLCPEFSVSLDSRPLPLRAMTARKSALVDGICVSGVMAGVQAPFEQLREVKECMQDFVVIANTGVHFDTIKEILGLVDGCCVATCIKKDGNAANEIVKEQVQRLVAKANE